ncbi:hypothetical protein L5515_013332 [Caenorhabditis briggsae]|uniref:Protein kinase domain-containing protein n=1 Tax=Caenorhabditis briggsae TaxID=6238 RepID=A0AAE9J642_CAEBR|nr:hypothetical protein L5515_013332 [Caenorhabditis briggsae]
MRGSLIIITLATCAYSVPISKTRRYRRNIFTDATLKQNRWILFFFLYGVLIMLFVVLCMLWTVRKRRQSQASVNNDSPENDTPNNSQNNHQREDITMETITQLEETEPLLNTQQENEECPSDLLSGPINERIDYLKFDESREIKRSNIKMFKPIGNGQFGAVHIGLLKRSNTTWEKGPTLPVAVKRPIHHYNAANLQLIYEELKLMCAIGKHPNVICLIGGVVNGLQKQAETWIVSEYVECGDLLEFLRKSRDIFENKLISSQNGYMVPTKKLYLSKEEPENGKAKLSTYDLLSFAYQIANGMDYLAKIRLVHRDLALRNILINKNKTIRIADFGLARKNNKGYYRVKHMETHLPYYYSSPESWDTQKFNEKSDVWSFGVCLYEIFSLGKEPYADVKEVQNSKNDLMVYLKAGNHLSRPEFCHPEVYKVMELCFNLDVDVRPNFSLCLEYFAEHLSTAAKPLFEEIEHNLHLEAEKQRKLSDWVQDDDDDDDDDE